MITVANRATPQPLTLDQPKTPPVPEGTPPTRPMPTPVPPEPGATGPSPRPHQQPQPHATAPRREPGAGGA